jgi:hypothetical protein
MSPSWLNGFNILTFSDKVVLVVLYVLMVLLVILWARFITKRVEGGILWRVIASCWKQKTENTEDESSTPHKSKEIRKHLKSNIIWQQSLDKTCNSIRKGTFGYVPKNERNSQKPYIPLPHINKILAKGELLYQSIKSRTPFLDNFTHAILLARIPEKLNYHYTGWSGILIPAY